MARFTSSSKKDGKKTLKAAVASAAGVAAGFALTVVGVAALTVHYCKSLMDVDYLKEDDVYDDEE